MIVVMLRLGLRAGEVAALWLDDIDWRAGSVTMHGKQARIDQLPLPADVGDAIAGYLRRGQPHVTGRELFVAVTGRKEEIARVLHRARLPRPPLRAASYEALFGLLASCGMRVGEAQALTDNDVDLAAGVLTMRHAKFNRTRLLALHPSVTAALHDYTVVRDRLCPTPRTDRFFVSATGRALTRSAIDQGFRAITEKLGLRTNSIFGDRS